MTTTLTEALIATHERLYPRLAALLKQVERVAGQRASTPVPEESARLARQLVGEAATLLGREGRGIAVPPANKTPPLDHAGLAVALGQAVAGLEAFEAAHSGWSAKSKCTVWTLDGPPRPVLRLLGPGTEANPVETRNPEAERLREEVYRLILGRYSAGYDAGYRDGRAGKAPRSEYCERIWNKVSDLRGGAENARLSGLTGDRVRYDPPHHLMPDGAAYSAEGRTKN
ncbi:hypothetical protein [Devosia sp. CN2-171]|uniref:hypothetical protein n=1 Tax=Devosia sp. CN2-171 TaxID=3400909 RepID=UPI003BF92056